MALSQAKTFLSVSREDAEARISTQISEGERILGAASQLRPDELSAQRRSWADYTNELLKKLFTTDALANEFATAGHLPSNTRWGPREWYFYDIDVNKNQVEKLRSIYKRLDLFEIRPWNASGPATPTTASPAQDRTKSTREVFVVHGRDDGVKQTVARFLENLRLLPIILHEKANRGRTVIEKFEDHSDVRFAVVLLTPDDEGRLCGEDQLKPRARQNVIMELGFFMGKLGRPKVCALKVGDVEEPSDVDGLVYVPFDQNGAWKLPLVKELEAAGIEIDRSLIV